MSQNYFPYGFFLWMLIKYFVDNNKKVAEFDSERELTSPEVEMKIKHLSNGRSLNITAFCYYLHMLNLEVELNITDETIETAAHKRHQLINKVDCEEEWPIATSDVKAAREYLLDRWLYLTSYN